MPNAKDPNIELKAYIDNIQMVKNGNISDWSDLPWELWFHDPDFLRCIKELETFWHQPQQSGTNWLQSMLLMTKITYATNVPSTPDIHIVATISGTVSNSTQP